MTDYPLTQIDWSDPDNWYGEDVGDNFASCTGTVDGTTATIEFPEVPEESTPEYTFEILPVDLTAADIVGVRVEIDVASGSGELSWVVHVSTGGDPAIIQRNDDLSVPTIGAGSHRYILGTGYDETDDGDPVGTPWDLALFLERLSKDGPDVTFPDAPLPDVTGTVSLMSGGPMSISAFRLVAYTAPVAGGVPPRRLRQRSW